MIIDPTVLAAVITGVVSPVLGWFAKSYQDKRALSKKDIVSDQAEKSIQIEYKLEELLEELGADRIWIQQIHNGGHYLPSNKSMQKFSMVFETSTEEIEPISFYFQNIPITLFNKYVTRLAKEDMVIIPDYDDPNINKYGLMAFRDITKNKSSYVFAVKDINDRFIGMLGVDYVKDKTALTVEQLTHLALEVSTVGGALADMLKK